MVLDTKAIRERQELKLSQKDLADVAHVDQSTVSLWETGQHAPSRAAAELIRQFCETKNIELAWKPAPEKRSAA
jgi:DNA-binding transcriptional regulator YiaG